MAWRDDRNPLLPSPPKKGENMAIHTNACLFAACGDVEVPGEDREEKEISGPGEEPESAGKRPRE